MTTSKTLSDDTKNTVFAKKRLWPDLSGPTPVIIVGLPRSGTSFLSHALSQLPDYFVFDDLYLLAHRTAKKAKGSVLSPNQLDELLFFLGWQIRARHRFGSYAIPKVEDERAEDLNDAIRESFCGAPGTVLDLQAEWLLRLALAKNARRWGFKMPKAFLQAQRLFDAYDKAQLIYMMRQPEDVLSSYKNMPDDPHGDGDPRRYHPLVYAFYWRLAARSFAKTSRQFPGKVHLMRFHEFVADPLLYTNRFAGILETEPTQNIVRPPNPNSSYKGKGDKTSRRHLTGLEARLVWLICRGEIAALGFEIRPKPPMAFSDLKDFLRTTMICACFHLHLLLSKLKR